MILLRGRGFFSMTSPTTLFLPPSPTDSPISCHLLFWSYFDVADPACQINDIYGRGWIHTHTWLVFKCKNKSLVDKYINHTIHVLFMLLLVPFSHKHHTLHTLNSHTFLPYRLSEWSLKYPPTAGRERSLYGKQRQTRSTHIMVYLQVTWPPTQHVLA